MIEGSIWTHADGGEYTLLAECEIKDDASGQWVPGVAYAPTGRDRPLYVTTVTRWAERFTLVQEAGRAVRPRIVNKHEYWRNASGRLVWVLRAGPFIHYQDGLEEIVTTEIDFKRLFNYHGATR